MMLVNSHPVKRGKDHRMTVQRAVPGALGAAEAAGLAPVAQRAADARPCPSLERTPCRYSWPVNRRWDWPHSPRPNLMKAVVELRDRRTAASLIEEHASNSMRTAAPIVLTVLGTGTWAGPPRRWTSSGWGRDTSEPSRPPNQARRCLRRADDTHIERSASASCGQR